jgi:hypothetical protein
MKWPQAMLVIASTFLAAAGLGAICALLGHSEFGFLPLAGPGYFLLSIIRLATQTRAGAGQPLAELLVANVAGYGVLGLLAGVGYHEAHRSRFWRMVLGTVVGFLAGAVLLAITFQFILLPFPRAGAAALVAGGLTFLLAAILGLLTAHRLSRPRPTTRPNGVHWAWRVLIAVIIGYSTNQAIWFGYYVLAYSRANPWAWFRATARSLSIAPITLIVLSVPIWAYVVLTRRYGPRPDYERETLCRRCGYILRGITEPRCPECGERI